MTDERLCKCGHVLSTHDRDTPSGPMCGMCKCALFEAAPSTDEGEARWVRDKIVGKYAIWKYNSAEYWVHLSLEAAIRAPLEEERDRLRKVVGNFDLRIEYADRLLESARWRASRAEAGELRARDIAALLGRTRWEERKARLATEERIRELEAARDRVRDALPEMLEMAGGGEFLTGLWAQRLLDSHNRAKDAEAENERLREALRDTASHLNMASLVVDTALLPSPPSSTEGTK